MRGRRLIDSYLIHEFTLLETPRPPLALTSRIGLGGYWPRKVLVPSRASVLISLINFCCLILAFFFICLLQHPSATIALPNLSVRYLDSSRCIWGPFAAYPQAWDLLKRRPNLTRGKA